MADTQKWTREELREELGSWKTSKLKPVYIHHFRLKEKHPEIRSQLESITEILSMRDFDERLKIYHQIRKTLGMYVKKEDYENASITKKMLEHFYAHVLD